MKKIVPAMISSACLIGACLLACSSSTSGSPSSVPEGGTGSDAIAPTDSSIPDKGTDAAAETGDGDGSAACNAVVNAATEATQSTVKAAAPAPTGGTILPGTYFQKEFNVYDPAGTASAPMPSGLTVTLVIAGTTMNSVQGLPDGSTDTFTETFSVNGTTLKRDLTCPKVAPDLAAVYSVSGNTLTIYETDPGSMNVAGSVYAKQP